MNLNALFMFSPGYFFLWVSSAAHWYACMHLCMSVFLLTCLSVFLSVFAKFDLHARMLNNIFYCHRQVGSVDINAHTCDYDSSQHVCPNRCFVEMFSFGDLNNSVHRYNGVHLEKPRCSNPRERKCGASTSYKNLVCDIAVDAEVGISFTSHEVCIVSEQFPVGPFLDDRLKAKTFFLVEVTFEHE